MINFNYELPYHLDNEERYSHWIEKVILSERKEIGEISFIFCDDEYLLSINKQYLAHDYYTDVISFDYTEGSLISGDVFISIERVRENAMEYNVGFDDELKRVIIHGILHYCGYMDKSASEEKLMRFKEEEKIKLFHVKQ
ncbi:rRNA maturation RNase YbeY [Flavobacterium sp.]